MARKGDNIYHRKDGRWEGRFVKGRVNSCTKFGYIFAKSYHEAKDKLATARHEWRARLDEAKRMKTTVRSVGLLWLKDSESFLKASSIAKYGDYLRCHIFPQFGECNMSDITNENVSNLCSHLLSSGGPTGQGLSPKTVSEILRVMIHLRKYALNRNYDVGYSGDGISIRQIQKPMRVFSQAERSKLRQYLTANPTPSNLGILICMSTGIRIGELCALKWDDISLDEKKLLVNKTMQRVRIKGNTKTKIIITLPKSGSSIRTIPLPDGICSFLLTAYQAGKFLVSGKEDKSFEPRTIQNRFKEVLSACNIADANFHVLRHTFATQCIEAGFDVKCLSEILGHASVNITLNRYVHPTMDLKRENMAKLMDS